MFPSLNLDRVDRFPADRFVMSSRFLLCSCQSGQPCPLDPLHYSPHSNSLNDMSRHMTARFARHLSPFTATASTLRLAQPIFSRQQYAATPISPRLIHTSPSLRASGGLTNLFDADDQGARPRIQVNKLNDEGFHLSDGLVIPGGVIFVENRAFLWDVDPVGVDELSGRGKWKENGWSKERFAVFEMVVPRPGENVRGALLSDG